MDLCRFTLKGLELAATVHRIIDGDTIDVIINVPLNVLTSHTVLKGRAKEQQSILRVNGGYDKDTSLEMLIRCRFYEIDAYEKNTDEGKKATISLRNHITEGDKIRVYIVDKGKYGRYVAELFIEDKSLNKLLLEKYPNYFRTYEERVLSNRTY